jgi:hypothetical protein
MEGVATGVRIIRVSTSKQSRHGSGRWLMDTVRIELLKKEWKDEYSLTGDDTELNRLRRIMLNRLIQLAKAILDD